MTVNDLGGPGARKPLIVNDLELFNDSCIFFLALYPSYVILYYMMRQRNPDDPRYKIDRTKKVFVYKNLHKDCWSIKQGGLVKVHTTHLDLYQCDFRVNRKGREKVLREKRKNVHAGIRGYITPPEPSYKTWDDIGWWEMSPVTYNPYKNKSFIEQRNGEPRWFANFVKLYPAEVRAI